MENGFKKIFGKWTLVVICNRDPDFFDALTRQNIAVPKATFANVAFGAGACQIHHCYIVSPSGLG